MNRAAEAQEPTEAALRRYAQHVEKEVLAAKDERTRFIRLVILMATEVALAETTSGQRVAPVAVGEF